MSPEFGESGIPGSIVVSKAEGAGVEEREVSSFTELTELFARHGLPLNEELVERLAESPVYHDARKGGGVNQASFFLAKCAKRPERLEAFSYDVREEIRNAWLAEHGPEGVIPYATLVSAETLQRIVAEAQLPETKMLAELIADIYGARPKDPAVAEVASLNPSQRIGSCTTAEVYFFDYLRGGFYRGNLRNGSAHMNVVVDKDNKPLFLEKVGLGESHSAIVLQPVYVGQVRVPPGSLVSLEYDFDTPPLGPETASGYGRVLNQSDLVGVDFLRFTTLVVGPQDRARAFKTHLEFQKHNQMEGAADIELAEFQAAAEREIGR